MSDSNDSLIDRVTGRHFRIGWWALLAFLTLGLVLESLHAFKVGWYLDVSNDIRRLMWTLAHTHGTLLSILNIVFALSMRQLGSWSDGTRVLASRCLLGALFLLPTGFFLGGIFIHQGDPGLGVILVPPGALLLWVAVFCTARAASRGTDL